MTSNEAQGRELAVRARAELDLGLARIADVAELVEGLGIDVLVTEMPEGADGFTRRNPSTNDILVAVTTATTPERQRLTLAHEFGHIFANDLAEDFVTTHRDPGKETRASTFARHFLAPLDGVRKLAAKNEGLSLVSDVIRHFGVSPAVALIQLKTIDGSKDYSEAEGRTARWFATRFGWDVERRQEELSAREPRPPRKILAAATNAYVNRKLSAEMLARLGKAALTDVREIEQLPEHPADDATREPFDVGDEDW